MALLHFYADKFQIIVKIFEKWSNKAGFYSFNWWIILMFKPVQSKPDKSDSFNPQIQLTVAQLRRGGCNLECGKLENGKLECFFVSKNVKTASPKKSNGKLKFSLENGFLENGVGNW